MDACYAVGVLSGNIDTHLSLLSIGTSITFTQIMLSLRTDFPLTREVMRKTLMHTLKKLAIMAIQV